MDNRLWNDFRNILTRNAWLINRYLQTWSGDRKDMQGYKQPVDGDNTCHPSELSIFAVHVCVDSIDQWDQLVGRQLHAAGWTALCASGINSNAATVWRG